MASPNQPDHAIAERTVKWLGQQLRVAQFTLKAQAKKRKALQRDEDTTRKSITAFKARIQWEIDQNPKLFRDIGLIDGE